MSLGLDSQEITYVEIDSRSTIPTKPFDILFVDEHYSEASKIQETIDQIEARKKVLLNATSEIELQRIDTILKKPFLPKDLYAIAQSLPSENTQTETTKSKELKIEKIVSEKQKEPTDTNEGSERQPQTAILDYSEIETIKELLDDDLFDSIETQKKTPKIKKDKRVKKFKKKSKKKQKDDISIDNHQEFQENILVALSTMKTKKIRKLLEGTQVSISIKFPKGE